MTTYLSALALTLVVLYGAFEAWPLLAGPALAVESPTEGYGAASGIVVVSGRVRRAAALTLDGAPLLPDESGAFSTTLTLPAGGSILTFVARDRFGRTITTTRDLFISGVAATSTNP